MNDRSEVYVVALLGESIGVVTELLWYLVMVEHRKVIGCELWTTEYSAYEARDGGLKGQGSRAFGALFAALGDRRDWLPRWDGMRAFSDPTAALDPGNIQVFIPSGPQGYRLPDASNRDQTELFSIGAHRRFEALKQQDHGPVVASLAGGRKTMSAVLHSAFTLWADSDDRLLHVLLVPEVERALSRDAYFNFVCPTEPVGGVPPEAQLAVFEVPFFPAAQYVGMAEHRRADELLVAAREQLRRARGAATLAIAVRRERGMARIELGPGGGFTVAPKTALLYACILEQTCKLQVHVDRVNALLDAYRVPRTRGARLLANDQTLRNLDDAIDRAIGCDRRLASLRLEHAGDWWIARPDPALDLHALSPEGVAATLFGNQTAGFDSPASTLD